MPSNNIKLLEVIFKTPKLRKRIDESLEAGSKINAIKELRGWCETTSYPAWLRDTERTSLRLMKNVIDRYAVRRTIFSKLKKLQNQIEKYCNKHGYDKMGYREGAKSKDGRYIHQYTDYELVDDHIGFIVNDIQWIPNHKNYKQYNKLWKKYKMYERITNEL